MTRTCAIDGYRDATCTVEWDGRVVAACDDCAGVTPDAPRIPSGSQLAADTLAAVRRMFARTGPDVTPARMCEALGLDSCARSAPYKRVFRALKQLKAELGGAARSAA